MGIYTLIKRLAFWPRATGMQAACAPRQQAWRAWPHPEVQVSVQGDRVIVCGEVATQAERNRLLSTLSRLTGGAVQDLIQVGGTSSPLRRGGADVARFGSAPGIVESPPSGLRLVPTHGLRRSALVGRHGSA